MPRDEVEEKCFLLCAPVIGKKRARELVNTIWNVEGVNNVRELRRLLRA